MEHLIDYPDVYKASIGNCKIVIEAMRITIIHVEATGDTGMCNKCKKMESEE